MQPLAITVNNAFLSTFHDGNTTRRLGGLCLRAAHYERRQFLSIVIRLHSSTALAPTSNHIKTKQDAFEATEYTPPFISF